MTSLARVLIAAVTLVSTVAACSASHDRTAVTKPQSVYRMVAAAAPAAPAAPDRAEAGHDLLAAGDIVVHARPAAAARLADVVVVASRLPPPATTAAGAEAQIAGLVE